MYQKSPKKSFTPYQIYYIFMDAFKGQVKPCQYFNVVFSKFFIQILELWLCFQLALVILLSLENNHRRVVYHDDSSLKN